ncbi:MAG: transporter substrate-binding domain-containing protein, partial [Acidobacteria bacterium]|nr:transporter substrate-binding domain-containing protein [Acidobacteriota bacterium]
MPTSGKAAARTALPHPPKTSQNVPMNSATADFVICSLLAKKARTTILHTLREWNRVDYGHKAHVRVPPWIAVALAVPASVDAQFVLRIGYNNNPPYYSPTPQGPPEGLVVDMFTQSAKEAGIVLEWVFAPGAPDAAMREDKFDLYAMSIVTDQRRTEFYLTDPWTTTEAWMVWLEGKEPKTPSLAGELLGVPESRFFQDIANRHFPGSRYHIRPSRSELLGDLCAEKIIAVLMEARSVTSSLLDRPARCNGVPLRIDLVQGTYQGLAILAKKQFRSYADQLHDGLVRQARDGSLAANYRKWRIGFAPELQLTDQLNRSNQARLFYELTTAAGAVLVVLCLFLVWRLRQAKRQAEGLTELKSRLLANVSHELRTPITGVIGLTEELRETPLSAAQTEIVSTVQASSRGLLRLLNDMLDLSRLEAGKLVIEQIPFLLTEPAAAVTTMLSHAAADNSVTLRLNAGGQEDRFVTGDPARLSQVLLNLAGNAVKFSPGGTVEVSIQPLGGDTYRFQVA